MTRASVTLRFTPDRSRHFLIPDQSPLVEGDLVLTTPSGDGSAVRGDDVAPFEVTETQARAWATHELRVTLDELKLGIDDRLNEVRQQLEAADNTPLTPSSPITPNAATALLDFFKALPRVVGQGISGDDSRVGDARQTMADLQRRLQEAGIDVDDRLQQFPERLADLRKSNRKSE